MSKIVENVNDREQATAMVNENAEQEAQALEKEATEIAAGFGITLDELKQMKVKNKDGKVENITLNRETLDLLRAQLNAMRAQQERMAKSKFVSDFSKKYGKSNLATVLSARIERGVSFEDLREEVRQKKSKMSANARRILTENTDETLDKVVKYIDELNNPKKNYVAEAMKKSTATHTESEPVETAGYLEEVTEPEGSVEAGVETAAPAVETSEAQAEEATVAE